MKDHTKKQIPKNTNPFQFFCLKKVVATHRLPITPVTTDNFHKYPNTIKVSATPPKALHAKTLMTLPIRTSFMIFIPLNISK